MPRASGVNIEPDVFKLLEEKEVKKASEEAHVVIWTPATGRRFALAGFAIYGATAAEVNFFLEDETTKFYTGIIQKVPATPVVINFPVAYVSIAKGNKLQLKLAEVTAGKVTATFWGTEEPQ